jgi:peptidoglycan/LPS O-acetylase OafA/YrhL
MINYINGINGLRALAVILVLVSHWLPKSFFLNKFPLGNIGVDIFFVISGFLITSILLKDYEAINLGKSSVLKKIKLFFLKRTLRIFPIYYMLLLFLYLTNGGEFRDNIFYYLSYTCNYLFYFTQNWHGYTAHFWSLAVEEQFYLFWPLLLFLFPKKHHFILIAFLITFGIIYSIFNVSNMSSILTFSCFHALGLGSMLAFLEINKIDWREKIYTIIDYLFYPLVLLFFLNYQFFNLNYFPLRLIISILTLKILLICIYDLKDNLIFKILNFKFLNYLGIISYGLYLYHNIVPKYFTRILRTQEIEIFKEEFSNVYIFSMVNFILLILLSSLSWFLFEKPLLKLKKYI